jgi:hypothetical protein
MACGTLLKLILEWLLLIPDIGYLVADFIIVSISSYVSRNCKLMTAVAVGGS